MLFQQQPLDLSLKQKGDSADECLDLSTKARKFQEQQSSCRLTESVTIKTQNLCHISIQHSLQDCYQQSYEESTSKLVYQDLPYPTARTTPPAELWLEDSQTSG